MIKDKTIFIAHNWTDSMICQQSKALAISLSKNNKVVFLSAKKTGSESKTINDNLVILEWPGKRPTTMKDFVFLVKLMRRNRPDIVLSNFAANNIMLFTASLFKVKVRICHYHTMIEQYIADHNKIGIRQQFNIWRKQFFFNKATHILPCSTAAKIDFLKYYNIKKERVYVFPNSVIDRNVWNRSDNKIIGFVGRLHKSKGVHLLLNAFAIVASEILDARLLIAGSGPMEQELKLKVKALGLSDKVDFLGEISSKKVSEFMSSLNVVVVPSLTDNLPTVVLEAFSTTTPVIGTNSGGIPDMIEPEKNGLLFERENISDLAEKIKIVLQNKAYRDKMASNARKIFEERYNVDAFINRFESLIAHTVQ